MESFNELTTIVLGYFLLWFTDYVPSASTRSLFGFGYIATNFANMAVHLVSMLNSGLRKAKHLLVVRLCYKFKCGRKIVQRCCLRGN